MNYFNKVKLKYIYSLKLFNLPVLLAFLFGFITAFFTLLLYTHYLIFIHEKHNFKSLTTNSELELVNLPEIRLFCMVLTCPKYHISRAAHVRATWGRRCTRLIFMSSENNEELDAIAIVEPSQDTYHDLWNKTRESFTYIYNNFYDEYDWFLKADDDTYVIMENLHYMLSTYESNIPIYFGHKMVRYEREYMSGGASYVLSKEALRRLVTSSFTNETLCPSPHRFAAEDLYLGICLKNVNVFLADSRDALTLDTEPKFFPLELSAFMEPNWNATISNWLFEITPHAIDTGLDCCSNYSIAFHYVEPQRMYAYEFLIYHLQTPGLKRQKVPVLKKRDLSEVTSIFSNTNIITTTTIKN